MGGGWVDGSARETWRLLDLCEQAQRPDKIEPGVSDLGPQTLPANRSPSAPQGSSKAPTVSTTASNIDRMDGDAIRMVDEDTKEGEMKSIETTLDKRQRSGATSGGLFGHLHRSKRDHPLVPPKCTPKGILNPRSHS